MALPDFDSSVGHSFGLEFDGIVIKQIQEVSGLKLEQDVIELKENTTDGKYIIKKLPGRPKAGEVTPHPRPDGRHQLPEVDPERSAREDEGRTEGRRRHRLRLRGRPDQALQARQRAGHPLWRSASLKAGDTSVLTEKLTVTFEQIEVE